MCEEYSDFEVVRNFKTKYFFSDTCIGGEFQT